MIMVYVYSVFVQVVSVSPSCVGCKCSAIWVRLVQECSAGCRTEIWPVSRWTIAMPKDDLSRRPRNRPWRVLADFGRHVAVEHLNFLWNHINQAWNRVSEDLPALLVGLVFVPDHGDFVVKGSQAINRAVDGDLVTRPRKAMVGTLLRKHRCPRWSLSAWRPCRRNSMTSQRPICDMGRSPKQKRWLRCQGCQGWTTTATVRKDFDINEIWAPTKQYQIDKGTQKNTFLQIP